jgi:hypothetical protein
MKLLIENWRKFVSEVKNDAKPDYLDLDKDGNKTEPMKKAAKDAKVGKKKDLEEALDDYPTPGQDEGEPTIGSFEHEMDLGADFPDGHEYNRQDKGTGYADIGHDDYGSLSYKEKDELRKKYGSALAKDKWWVIGRTLILGDEELEAGLAEKPYEDGKNLSPSAKKEWERIKSRKESGQLDEEEAQHLSKAEKKEKEKIVKGMKSSKKGFEKRYPGRGEEVMYATATKKAKEMK